MEIKLKDIKPLNNHVLIKPDGKLHDSIRMKDGTHLYLDPTFSEGRHAQVTGTVIKCPEKLVYNDLSNPNNMEWETDIEIKEGDKVWMSWDAVLMSFKEEKGKKLIIDDEVYLFINYRNIYVAKRGDKTICLNGYCLVSPIKEVNLPDELKPRHERNIQSNIKMPDKKLKKRSGKYGVVAYTGKPNKRYYMIGVDAVDDPRIKPGDLVLLDKESDIFLEYEYHSQFNQDNQYYRVQRQLMLLMFR